MALHDATDQIVAHDHPLVPGIGQWLEFFRGSLLEVLAVGFDRLGSAGNKPVQWKHVWTGTPLFPQLLRSGCAPIRSSARMKPG